MSWLRMASQRFPYPVLAGKRPSGTRAPEPGSRLMPVLKPRLPLAAEIQPYLEMIDVRRWYSNAGPLVTQLEERLSCQMGFRGRGVVMCANATSGITAALLARRVPEGSLCLMPSWTFAATPHAARAAGLTPWFHDVDRRTWALNPDEVMETLKRMPRPVGAALVVAPFGAPLEIDAWQQFEERTGIAVVIDAAAGFDTARPSLIPLVVSLHATKMLGAGEGGFISTTDSRLLERVRAACNFGFQGSRNAMLPAMNAKMSEYHAAVGLAALAQWQETRRRHARIAEWYGEVLRHVPGVSLQPHYGHGWVTGTTSVILPPRTRSRVAIQLRQSGIETRSWWGDGCHLQPAFMVFPRSALAVTEELGARVLGLPHFPDMAQTDVERVAGALENLIGGRVREHRHRA